MRVLRCCPGRRRRWTAVTHGSLLLRWVLAAALLLSAGGMLLWGGTRVRVLHQALGPPGLPLATPPATGQPPTNSVVAAPSFSTATQVRQSPENGNARNARKEEPAGWRGDGGEAVEGPTRAGGMPAAATVRAASLGPRVPKAGQTWPQPGSAGSRGSSGGGGAGCAADASTVVDAIEEAGPEEEEVLIPRVALLFLVQGDGLLANEALWAAFLAGADSMQLRRPPSAAAVRKAVHVDLEGLVGGPLKPPLRSFDEMAYQGYAQQHILPVAPGEELPSPSRRQPPPPPATAATAGRPVASSQLQSQRFAPPTAAAATGCGAAATRVDWSDASAAAAAGGGRAPATGLDASASMAPGAEGSTAPAQAAVSTPRLLDAAARLDAQLTATSRRLAAELFPAPKCPSAGGGAGGAASKAADGAEPHPADDHRADVAAAAGSASAVYLDSGAWAEVEVLRILRAEAAELIAGSLAAAGGGGDGRAGDGDGGGDGRAGEPGVDEIRRADEMARKVEEAVRQKLALRPADRAAQAGHGTDMARRWWQGGWSAAGRYQGETDEEGRRQSKLWEEWACGRSGDFAVLSRQPSISGSNSCGGADGGSERRRRGGGGGGGESDVGTGVGEGMEDGCDVTVRIPHAADPGADGHRRCSGGRRLTAVAAGCRCEDAAPRHHPPSAAAAGASTGSSPTTAEIGHHGRDDDDGDDAAPVATNDGGCSSTTSTTSSRDDGAGPGHGDETGTREAPSSPRRACHQAADRADRGAIGAGSTSTRTRTSSPVSSGAVMPPGGGWRRYFRIFAHLSDATRQPPAGGVLSLGELVPAVNTSRGYSQHVLMEAELRLIAAALRDPWVVKLVLLSETSIPLRPAPHVWSQLVWEQRSRLDACRGVEMDIARWRAAMATPHLSREHWRKSSQWFALTRQHAALAAADRHVVEAFHRFCYYRRSALPTAATATAAGSSLIRLIPAPASSPAPAPPPAPLHRWATSQQPVLTAGVPRNGGRREGGGGGGSDSTRVREGAASQPVGCTDCPQTQVAPQRHPQVGQRGPQGGGHEREPTPSTADAEDPSGPGPESGRCTDDDDGGGCGRGGGGGGCGGGVAGNDDGGANTSTRRGSSGRATAANASVARRAARRDVTADPWVLQRGLTHGLHPCVSDEHYLPTLLASYGLEHQTDCLGEPHYADWTGGGGWHPRSFLPADVRQMAADLAEREGRSAAAILPAWWRRLWLEAMAAVSGLLSGQTSSPPPLPPQPDGRRLLGPDRACWGSCRGGDRDGGAAAASGGGVSDSAASLSRVFSAPRAEPHPFGAASAAGSSEACGGGGGGGGGCGEPGGRRAAGGPRSWRSEVGRDAAAGAAREAAAEGRRAGVGVTAQPRGAPPGGPEEAAAAVTQGEGEAESLRLWLEQLGYVPLAYRCHLFGRKFPVVSAHATLRLALACPPGGLGLGSWCAGGGEGTAAPAAGLTPRRCARRHPHR